MLPPISVANLIGFMSAALLNFAEPTHFTGTPSLTATTLQGKLSPPHHVVWQIDAGIAHKKLLSLSINTHCYFQTTAGQSAKLHLLHFEAEDKIEQDLVLNGNTAQPVDILAESSHSPIKLHFTALEGSEITYHCAPLQVSIMTDPPESEHDTVLVDTTEIH